MKKTLIFVIAVLSIIVIYSQVGTLFPKNNIFNSSHSTSDGKSISKPEFTSSDVAGDINHAWDYIESGNQFLKNNDYEAAAESFKKSFTYTYGPKALSGLKLAETYEIMHKYEEGVRVLDEMISKGYLSEKGIQNASEIKSRLLAAKAKKESAATQSLSN